MRIDQTVLDRINKHSAQDPSGCLLWTGKVGGKDNRPYIKIDGKNCLVSRVIWTWTNGPIPTGLKVCHRCDRPRCIEVGHFFLGTQKQNMQDCAQKGRIVSHSGEKHSLSKLKASDIPSIRSDPRSHAKVAAAYGVWEATIWKIRARRTWKHIP